MLGDADHSSFGNLTFTSRTTVLAEDRGDTLHDQLDRLDSIWAYDVNAIGGPGSRFLAIGWPTDEDNEPTGGHFSDGDSSLAGLIGGKIPNPRKGRGFSHSIGR